MDDAMAADMMECVDEFRRVRSEFSARSELFITDDAWNAKSRSNEDEAHG